MPRRLILDVDTGTDDAVAIMLAALHPDLELLAVTTVNGNVEISRCTDNSLRTLEWIGRGGIPVYEGLAKPIVRSDFPTPRAAKRDAKVHPAVLPLPEAKGSKQGVSAPVFLVGAFANGRADTTLVAVGPLSNLAAAIALDPSFVGNVPELMIMGGAIDKSNVTPSAEFNIWADPEAASVVLGAAFKKVTMVPLDATHEALISLDQCRELRALNSPAGIASADFIEHRIAGYQAHQPTGVPATAPVHDALCIAALVDSEVIRTRFLNVVVETMGEYTIGRTVVDHERRTARAPNCNVALNADRKKFFSILLSTFARKGA
jgi:inosine-uridine nucleoside N-ribohydrolase